MTLETKRFLFVNICMCRTLIRIGYTVNYLRFINIPPKNWKHNRFVSILLSLWSQPLHVSFGNVQEKIATNA